MFEQSDLEKETKTVTKLAIKMQYVIKKRVCFHKKIVNVVYFLLSLF